MRFIVLFVTAVCVLFLIKFSNIIVVIIIIIIVIINSNWTEWSTIQGVILRVIAKYHEPEA